MSAPTSMINPLIYQNRMGQPQMQQQQQQQQNITLTSAMASALYKIPNQISNTILSSSGNHLYYTPLNTSNGENGNENVENEENKNGEAEKEEPNISETEAKINVIMSQCETLSHRLKQLLHDHLQPFMEDGVCFIFNSFSFYWNYSHNYVLFRPKKKLKAKKVIKRTVLKTK